MTSSNEQSVEVQLFLSGSGVPGIGMSDQEVEAWCVFAREQSDLELTSKAVASQQVGKQLETGLVGALNFAGLEYNAHSIDGIPNEIVAHMQEAGTWDRFLDWFAERKLVLGGFAAIATLFAMGLNNTVEADEICGPGWFYQGYNYPDGDPACDIFPPTTEAETTTTVRVTTTIKKPPVTTPPTTTPPVATTTPPSSTTTTTKPTTTTSIAKTTTTETETTMSNETTDPENSDSTTTTESGSPDEGDASAETAGAISVVVLLAAIAAVMARRRAKNVL